MRTVSGKVAWGVLAGLLVQHAVASPPRVSPPPVRPLIYGQTLQEPPRYHQRLFDTNEVSFGLPAAVIPRTAIVTDALADLRRADQDWLDLPPAGGAENRYRGWLALLRDVRAEPRGVQVDVIHRFVNAQPYRPDDAVADDWQAPWQFLTGTGDCEEYAITKYVSLRHLGVARERLRIVVVYDTARQEHHAVLALLLDDDVLILDNRSDVVGSHTGIRHLKPIYSLNETEIWFHWRDGETAPTVFTPHLLRLVTHVR